MFLPVLRHDSFITTACRRWHARPPLKGAYSQVTINSVPHWSAAFSHDGTIYPYTIVGNKPATGGMTQIRTALVPISLEFDEYVDQHGKPLILDVTPTIARVVQSPNFTTYNYGTGDVQFADAVQRAQFASYSGVELAHAIGAATSARTGRAGGSGRSRETVSVCEWRALRES